MPGGHDGSVARTFAAEQLALAGAHLLEAGHVLVIHERRPRATFLGAKAATILAAPTQLLANHEATSRTNDEFFGKPL